MADSKWVQVGGGNFHKWTEPGQSLEGLWRGHKDGKFGPVGMLDTREGRVTFPLHTALLSKMEEIASGAEVRIVYTGKQVAKGSGNEFKAFDVFTVAGADSFVKHEKPVEGDEDNPLS